MADPESASRPLLAEKLAARRRKRFVGREQEKSLFLSALSAAEPPFVVLHIYGPGGVGKTSLVSELMHLAQEAGVTPIRLDGRDIEASPEGFLLTLRLALGIETNRSPLEVIATYPRSVLFLDTYESLNPLDGWLREQFLPLLPGNTLVVLAGRNPLSGPWRSDPGWRELVYSVSLRNLRPEESREYLSRQGIPQAQHPAVLEFTHGHPLALALVVEVLEREATYAFRPDAAPDVVRSLLERFVQQVPSPTHRAALEASALVSTLTEPLLAVVLQLEDANPYFAWLRGLSFMEAGPQGLFPHDLAREALDADLRWRNPDGYTELHRRARGYYTQKLQETRGLEQQRILADDVYLHRHNPLVKPFLEWKQLGSVFGERGRPQDHPAVLEIIQQHEGAAAAQMAAHWLQRQPQGLTVYRSVADQPAGLMLVVGLHQTSPQDRQADLVVQRAWDYLQRHPMRPGEEALLFRFWMAKDSYQAVSPVQSLVFLNAVQHYISNIRLAWTFFPISNFEFWTPAFLYMNLFHAAELDYSSGPHLMGVFAHDWRQQPATAWLEMLGERELATLDPAQLEAERPQPLLVLSQPEFEEAVKSALRDFNRPEVLAQSLLLRSRLLPEASAKALRTLLWETAQTLKAHPKTEKLYRALERTYLEPAATQELAAELLDLPFSTYRRHLVGATQRLIETLWQLELGEK